MTATPPACIVQGADLARYPSAWPGALLAGSSQPACYRTCHAAARQEDLTRAPVAINAGWCAPAGHPAHEWMSALVADERVGVVLQPLLAPH